MIRKKLLTALVTSAMLFATVPAAMPANVPVSNVETVMAATDYYYDAETIDGKHYYRIDITSLENAIGKVKSITYSKKGIVKVKKSAQYYTVMPYRAGKTTVYFKGSKGTCRFPITVKKSNVAISGAINTGETKPISMTYMHKDVSKSAKLYGTYDKTILRVYKDNGTWYIKRLKRGTAKVSFRYRAIIYNYTITDADSTSLPIPSGFEYKGTVMQKGIMLKAVNVKVYKDSDGNQISISNDEGSKALVKQYAESSEVSDIFKAEEDSTGGRLAFDVTNNGYEDCGSYAMTVFTIHASSAADPSTNIVMYMIVAMDDSHNGVVFTVNTYPFSKAEQAVKDIITAMEEE